MERKQHQPQIPSARSNNGNERGWSDRVFVLAPLSAASFHTSPSEFIKTIRTTDNPGQIKTTNKESEESRNRFGKKSPEVNKETSTLKVDLPRFF
jgi:hypothetical protein